MFHKKLKQVGACLLAFSMVLGSVQLPAMGAKAAEGNIAGSATATVSNVESGTSFDGSKAIDGNTTDSSSRWATDESDGAEWIQLAWDEAQTMKSFIIYWQRRNVTKYSIETSNDGAQWKKEAEFSQKPELTKQEIVLDTPVTAKYVRLYITSHDREGKDGEIAWNNVSLYEFEVYAGEAPDNRSEMEKFMDSIAAPQIADDGGHITMPQVPAGMSVRFCADYEQVIGEDGTIYTPLQDKTVKGFYEVSKGEEEAKTNEFTITVPGKYTADSDANAKPAVIPELQEWYGTKGQFAISGTSKIVAEERLADVAARFANDYKEVTGTEIKVMTGTLLDTAAGDFYLTLDTQDQGLGKEGYLLKVGNVAVVEAAEATGAYWGTISLLQILKQANGVIAKGIARDYPKYEVRGFSFDVGRKPFSLETLYDFTKNMAWYKMNNLQMHLSDNLIFIEDYKNANISMDDAIKQIYGGFRLESGLVNKEVPDAPGLTSEDMYYTKDEFRKYIQDSRAMGVQIVPEFDMPAHAFPITRAFPQYMTRKVGGHGWLVDELDVTNQAAIDFAKTIWADYFEGDNPVFDKETTVHIGTDEFHGQDGQPGKEAFRNFSDQMIEYVQSTGRTVRMWGSLSNKSGTTPVRSKDVQLNIWNTGYANPKDMYDMGFDLINTLEGPNYIVPAAGYYNDYINAQNIYNNWQPNVIGNLTASAADDQILGGCYAIWHDSIDTRANGISEYDSFDRFFQAVPAYGAKLWGDAKDRNYKEMTQVFAKTGTAPGTKTTGEVKSATETVLDYSFDGELEKDAGANNYDATESKNVSQEASGQGKALKLNGGESYLTSSEEIDKIGSNAVLTMRVKMDADAAGEQILCESKDAFGIYGTYAVKASQKHTGKVGFSREGYDYSFDYTLPKGEWVELTFQGGKENAALYVNGELVDNNPDIYFANHETTELSAKLTKEGIRKVTTLMIPVGRIGSKTKSFKGLIDRVTVTKSIEITGSFEDAALPQNQMTAGACSTHASEGSIAAMLDGNPATYWHTDYASDAEKGNTKDHNHYITLTFNNDEAKTINMLGYLPRQDSGNGRIFQYSIDVTKADGTVVTNYASGTWADDATEKYAIFESIEAKSVKLNILTSGSNHGTAAEMNLYNVSVSKEDVEKALEPFKNLKEEEYTTQSWNAFHELKTAIEAIVNNPNSTLKDTLAAYGKLQELGEVLVKKPEDPDVSALQKQLDELENMNLDAYTEESVALLKEQIAQAKKILADPLRSSEVADMAAMLEKAQKEVLIRKPVNKGEISSVIADADKVDRKGYRKDTVEAFEKALAQAKKVLADENATQEQVDEAIKALKAAQAGLKKETEKPVKTVPEVGTTKVVKNVTYKVTKSDEKNGTVTVSKIKAVKSAVIQPTVEIEGYTFTVTAIAAKASQKNKKLKSLTIGANVTTIGSKAFFQCSKLSKVTLKGKKAPKIGKQAFKKTAAKCKVTAPKKMAKKQFKLLKSRMKSAGMSKKAVYKK